MRPPLRLPCLPCRRRWVKLSTLRGVDAGPRVARIASHRIGGKGRHWAVGWSQGAISLEWTSCMVWARWANPLPRIALAPDSPGVRGVPVAAQ